MEPEAAGTSPKWPVLEDERKISKQRWGAGRKLMSPPPPEIPRPAFKENDFPGGPVVQTLLFHCRGARFKRWLRESPDTASQRPQVSPPDPGAVISTLRSPQPGSPGSVIHPYPLPAPWDVVLGPRGAGLGRGPGHRHPLPDDGLTFSHVSSGS